MNLPLLTIIALAGELDRELRNALITNASPLSRGTGLYLQTNGGSGPSFRLSCQRELFVPFLHDSPPAGAKTAGPLANLGRLLCGHTILSVGSWRQDRMLRLELQKSDEIQGIRRRTLILELVPRRQNIILVDSSSGQILETFRRVSGQMSRVRRVLPGHPYEPPPPPAGLNPQKDPAEAFLQCLRAHGQMTLAEAFARCLPWATTHLLPAASKDLPVRGTRLVEELEHSFVEQLWGALGSWVEELQKGPRQPTLLLDEQGHPCTLLPYDPPDLPGTRKRPFDTMSQALEEVFQDHMAGWAIESSRKVLASLLHRALHSGRRAIRHLEIDLDSSQRSEEYKRMGEIITTHMGALKRGQSQAKLPDPYTTTGEFVLISLDPRLSPAENAQRYFKRFRKARAGLPQIQKRLDQFRRRAEHLEKLRARLHQAGDPDQLAKIQKALDRLGIAPPTPAASGQARKPPAEKRPLSFTLGQDWTVWVGRNNKENDHLTHRLAKSGDLWFHAQGVPGSHVILRREGRRDEPSKWLLEEVAGIAAHFSRARHSRTVPVIYTEKRYVRKPRGAAPGLVVVEREKTLFVKPELPERVEGEEK